MRRNMSRTHTLLPPPLWGRVGEGGSPGRRRLWLTPLPDRLRRSDLPHKGGGNKKSAAQS
ncbi:hypothetical protein BDS110ZK25_35320 [Bradyrhizobium diazoefficiens]|uniref:Uncharacterized protein n=1 Tax=Bradyrhizobium diazoefficiens TaxID=1355477 RepID=A0A810BTA2_9BRAD|nr:branched-chain amino acid transport system ATP-binding protein [Bradyrhizobium diazoefficiens]BCA00754.1 hypothetical protein H12S4_16580 [Bradyrhizobium diazoefficiens]BCA18435.1 hypothetical protein BDHH15_16500 [Bradyrhizobium diazoefficiens]BCE18981.1 hypothetical protein XF1B_16620 [Bradyrhizobium diazoefficiens]BCE27878.1 hypothetical protein XF2B_16470 [Bradyrhizobium diazoefficiens]